MPVPIVDLLYRWSALPTLRGLLAAGAWVSPKLRYRHALAAEPVPPTPGARPILWVHAASMGEFEQVVPVLERLHTHVTIVATFTSPSGYDHGKRLSHLVASVRILPLDTRRNMRALFDAIRPAAILIDRYDVWRNMVLEADRRSIPAVLVNATMPSAGTGVLRRWTADTYRRLHTIIAVSDAHGRHLASLTGRTIPVLPDTRVDRLIHPPPPPDELKASMSRHTGLTVVVGSSWEADETLVIDALHALGEDGRSIRLVIVPHEPTEANCRMVERRLPCTRLSKATPTTSGHILVDRIGILRSLYTMADAAWVGGGFGAGVHSVAEAAACSIPIACGPAIDRSVDACSLATTGALTVAHDHAAAVRWMRTVVLDAAARESAAEADRRWIAERTGSSGTVADVILNIVGERSARQ